MEVLWGELEEAGDIFIGDIFLQVHLPNWGANNWCK